ncbi:MAG: hypothetical protein M1819_004061 [Sarea resinae]|nr:MAG: hypothetical protein M1819_004061 [Sarea resinae]
MGKKKRGHPDVEEILSRPWCYYCERDFDDLKILISHQKAKHYKCERCGRRLNTAGGLSVHMNQVHKENLTAVENALPNRSSPDIEIFGIEGIPEDVLATHNQRVLSQFHQAEADRRQVTGNPPPGGASNAPKKPKFESPSELKKRLAEHKAKKAAEQAAGISSGDVTPLGAAQGSQSPAYPQNVAPFQQAGSPSYTPQQQPYGGGQNPPSYSSYPQSYGEHGQSFQQHQNPYPPQPGFASPGQQYPGVPQFTPAPQYSPPGGQPFAAPYSTGPPRPLGAASPQLPFQHGQQSPAQSHTPLQNGLAIQRPGSLPPAPGLPSRPSFGVPQVNAFQFQQMHQGQVSGPPNSAAHPAPHTGHEGAAMPHGQNGQVGHSPASTAPNLVSNSPQQPNENAPPVAEYAANAVNEAGNAESKAAAPAVDKKAKKDKSTKLMYSDNEISPEEKMAKLSRYAFVPDDKGESVLGNAVEATVTGVVDDQAIDEA